MRTKSPAGEMAVRARLGATVALEMAAQARLGAAGALEMAARAIQMAARAKNAVFCSSVVGISFCPVQLCFVHGYARVSH